MLAALQQDSYGSGSLDPSSSAFNADAYGSMSYMDTVNQEDALGSGHQPGLSFSDFTGPGVFDVSTFTQQDIGVTAQTPGSEGEHETESVKSEQPTA